MANGRMFTYQRIILTQTNSTNAHDQSYVAYVIFSQVGGQENMIQNNHRQFGMASLKSLLWNLGFTQYLSLMLSLLS